MVSSLVMGRLFPSDACKSWEHAALLRREVYTMSKREQTNREVLETVATASVVALECRIWKIGLGAARRSGLMDQYEEALANAARKRSAA